jgi:hypothetical protein
MDNPQELEREIKGISKFPRIKLDHINTLAERITYKFIVPDGTTTTLCIAFLDEAFRLAIGESACVDPRNYNPKIGKKIAKEKAVKLAIDALWELEGYRLYRKIHG